MPPCRPVQGGRRGAGLAALVSGGAVFSLTHDAKVSIPDNRADSHLCGRPVQGHTPGRGAGSAGAGGAGGGARRRQPRRRRPHGQRRARHRLAAAAAAALRAGAAGATLHLHPNWDLGGGSLSLTNLRDLSRSLCGSAVTDMAAASCRSSATHEHPQTEPRCLDIHKRADAALALSDIEQDAMLTSNAAHVAQLKRSAATADARHLRLHCEHRHHTPAAGHIER